MEALALDAAIPHDGDLAVVLAVVRPDRSITRVDFVVPETEFAAWSATSALAEHVATALGLLADPDRG